MITLENISYIQSNKIILSNIWLTVKPGSIVLIVGENGSGKSTLLKLIATILQPTTGTISIDKLPLFKLNSLHQNIHYINFSADRFKALYNDTIQTYLEKEKLFSGSYLSYGLSIENSIKIFNLNNNKNIKYPSSGQKKKILFNKLLYNPKPIWLLDEPTTLLDISSLETLNKLILEHRLSGGIVFLATHTNLDLLDAQVYVIAK